MKDILSAATLNNDFNPNLPTVVDTDASTVAIGAALQQTEYRIMKPISFASKTLTETESKWSTREQEALAIIWALQKFRRYLIGRPFVVQTDHSSLQWLLDAKQPKLIRWAILMSEFTFQIIYQKGTANEHADCLSRNIPIDHHESELTEHATPQVAAIEVRTGIQGLREEQERDSETCEFCQKGRLEEINGMTFQGRIFVPLS